MKHVVYWLISEDYNNTYIGFSNNLDQRISQHKYKAVNSTINFGTFRCFRLEEINSLEKALIREKYWKRFY